MTTMNTPPALFFSLQNRSEYLRYLGSSKSRATIVLRLFRFEMFDGHGSNKVCKFVNSIFKVYSFFVRYVLIDFVFLAGFCDGFDDV